MRAVRTSGSPRAVSLIVFAMIHSTAGASPFGIPLSSFRPGANVHRVPPVAKGRLAATGYPPYLEAMNLELSDEETAALTQELHNIVKNARYPFPPPIPTLSPILTKLTPPPH